MDDIPPADESRQYSSATTYVITEAATESDAKEAAAMQFREEVSETWRIKDLQTFSRTHPKGYEVAVVANIQE